MRSFLVTLYSLWCLITLFGNVQSKSFKSRTETIYQDAVKNWLENGLKKGFGFENGRQLLPKDK